jgi:hypothetical protein
MLRGRAPTCTLSILQLTIEHEEYRLDRSYLSLRADV